MARDCGMTFKETEQRIQNSMNNPNPLIQVGIYLFDRVLYIILKNISFTIKGGQHCGGGNLNLLM